MWYFVCEGKARLVYNPGVVITLLLMVIDDVSYVDELGLYTGIAVKIMVSSSLIEAMNCACTASIGGQVAYWQ